MTKEKKSFVLYSDQKELIEALTDEQAGKLIKHILKYVNNENPTLEDPLLKIAFMPIKQQLKRDLEKWERQREQRIEAGKKSAESRQRALTSVNEKVRKATVNVNDNVNVSVNVNDNVNEINNTKDVPTNVETPPQKKGKLIFSNATIEDFEHEKREAFQIAKSFHDLFVKNLTEKGAPLTNLKKADSKAWTNQIVLMLKNKEATIEQLRNVWHFVNKDEFWKVNVQSVPKLREKFSTIYLQSKKIKNEGNSNNGTGGVSEAFKRKLFATLTGQDGTEPQQGE